MIEECDYLAGNAEKCNQLAVYEIVGAGKPVYTCLTHFSLMIGDGPHTVTPVTTEPPKTLEEWQNYLRGYLDVAIVDWRRKRREAENSEDEILALHYVDAFQSVRITMFGQPLMQA